MYPQTFEHPIKRSTRRAVRQFLFCVIACPFLVSFALQTSDWQTCLVAGLFLCVPVFLIFKVLQFAVGPAISSKLRNRLL
jgi:hypothetical protein